jgi:beta-phosphoglucomutase
LGAPSAFIFDFDGVVVDSIAVHLDAWKVAVDETFGIEIAQPTRLVGHSTTNIAMILAEEAGAPGKAPELAALKRKILDEGSTPVQALPGALDLFGALTSENLPWGIASNATKSFIENTLQRLGVQAPMVVSVEDVRNPKPAPDVFLLCATRLKISPHRHREILVFEDSVHGLTAAVRSGMCAIGIETQQAAAELYAAGARKVCKNLSEVLASGWVKEAPIQFF